MRIPILRLGDILLTSIQVDLTDAEVMLFQTDVLRAITMNSAHQLRLDEVVGSIEVGKFADLIVLDRDFMTVPDEELGRNRVLLTMAGAKVVMAIDAFASMLPASQRALNGRALVLSPRGSTGHSIPTDARGAPHGDGHRH